MKQYLIVISMAFGLCACTESLPPVVESASGAASSAQISPAPAPIAGGNGLPINSPSSGPPAPDSPQPGPTPSPSPQLPAPAPSPSSQFNYTAPDYGVDLRRYFPAQYTRNISRLADGRLYSDYRYYAADAVVPAFVDLYNSFFNLNKSGRLQVLEKRYGPNNETCIATYAQFFMGDDLSVTEVGDWYATDGCNPAVLFGYGISPGGAAGGLAWSGAGGLATPLSQGGGRSPAFANDLSVRGQSKPGDVYTDAAGYKAWNDTKVIEVLPTFTPAHGSRITFRDVVRLVFYHGTHSPGHTEIVCTNLDQRPEAKLYRHHPGYRSYASEVYLAPGVGIIQEAFLYTEDGSYWGMPNCVGLALDADYATAKRNWTSYIDR